MAAPYERLERNEKNERVRTEQHKTFLDGLEGVCSELGIEAPRDYRPEMTTVKHRRWRRQRHLEMEATLGVMTLREHDGVLLLDEGWRRTSSEDRLDFSGATAGRRAAAGLRRSRTWRRQRRALTGELVAQVPFERLDRSQVSSALEALDAKLTPEASQPNPLRELGLRGLKRSPGIARTGKVMLLVHGTFSNSDNLIAALERTDHGQAFLTDIWNTYDQIATFDHRTLGVSPMLNARALELLTRGSQAHIDVICHSRGGLVTRWWLEAFDNGPPLAGTGLASPPRLRGALSNMANISRALASASATASAAVPFLTVATGLFRIVSSITSLMAKTPVIDAAVALVPGLHAQSRVGNNRELISLRSDVGPFAQRYFAIQSNFESEQAGWKFWRYFTELKSRVTDWATDKVFEGPNDLVVDTASMTEFSDRVRLPKAQVHDFGTTDEVHHTNYFLQPDTLRMIKKWLR